LFVYNCYFTCRESLQPRVDWCSVSARRRATTNNMQTPTNHQQLERVFRFDFKLRNITGGIGVFDFVVKVLNDALQHVAFDRTEPNLAQRRFGKCACARAHTQTSTTTTTAMMSRYKSYDDMIIDHIGVAYLKIGPAYSLLCLSVETTVGVADLRKTKIKTKVNKADDSGIAFINE
jgi:hypothetical protein